MGHTLLGLDIGSSSVKASLVDGDTGKTLAHATAPLEEMEIVSRRPGWAEQSPDLWWDNVTVAISHIQRSNAADLTRLKAVGIAYQMHGLVLVDSAGNPLRPAIIWCDSRAVSLGESAYRTLGSEICGVRLGNSPGNFTASKLAWVKENEPEVFARAAYFMLPGDYIAFKLTGKIGTTPSGLSEGILWDFSKSSPADFLLNHLGISGSLMPPVSPNCETFAEISPNAAE
jgi:xylulokinase